MHISNRFDIVRYNIINCIVFNVTIIMLVLFFPIEIYNHPCLAYSSSRPPPPLPRYRLFDFN